MELYKKNLDKIISELEDFTRNEFSSKFKYLTPKEDRQLFFLAKILTRLKNIDEDIFSEEDLFGNVVSITNYKRKKKI